MAPPVIHLIPHTHWDREWYLPLGGFRARLVEMVDDLIALLDREPGIPGFLLDGQAALLEDYLAVRPERRSQVSDLVRAGRIDTGPWYILADEQIPSGESLLRNLALGRSHAEAWGRGLPVIYSPDAFGHPAALPAVGKEFGLGWAVVWRGLDDKATGGKDLAWWRAPDGEPVLLYHLPPDGYEIGSNLLVDHAALDQAWRRVKSTVLPRAATNQVALFVGADHHAAPSDLATLPVRLRQLDRSVEFRLSTLEQFFTAAEREAGKIATLEGELRWSYGYTWTLQGTLATRAQLKRRNSETELRLTRRAEPLSALARLGLSASPVLRQAWREVVQCHFHDSICGCSSDLVARAVGVRLDDADAAAAEVVRTSVQRLLGQDQDLMREGAGRGARLGVWNGAARPRGGVVIGEATFFVRDVLVGPPGNRVPRRGKGFAPFALSEIESGMSVAPQILSIEPGLERRDAPRHYPDQDEVERVRFAFPLPRSIPGMGLRLMEPVAALAEPMEEFVAAGARSLWNGRVMGTIDRTGTLTLEEPVSGARYPGLLALESELDQGDSYSFCPVRGDRPAVSRGSVRPKVEAAGPLVATLSWRGTLAAGGGPTHGRGRVTTETTVELVGDSAALRARIAFDNQATDHRLRLRFPTGLRGATLRAGAQFGWVEREPVRAVRGKGEWPVPTAPAHRWVAGAAKHRGLAIFAPGFFEYEWTREGDLLVTVLRAVGQLSRSDLPSRPGHAGWPTAIPLGQSPGPDMIELGIAPITAEDLADPARLERIWEDLFVPPLSVWERDATVLPPPPAPTVELEGDRLVFSACLPGSEPGGLEVRCFNTAPEPVAGTWRFGLPVIRATRIRADGTPRETLPLDPENPGQVGFTARAREIVTVSVLLALP